MDVKLPDGTVVQNIPDGTSKADLVAKLKANGMNVPDSWSTPPAAAANPSYLDSALGALGKISNYASNIPAQAEVAAHYGSGALSAIPAGWAGILSGGNGDVVNKVQSALTYQPRTDMGKAVVGNVDKVASIPAQLGDRAGGAVTDATGSPTAGAATNTLIQALPMMLSGARGGLVKPAEVIKGSDVTKAQTLAASNAEGLVVPPSLTKNPPLAANTANGLGGIAETNKLARDMNTPTQNNIAAREVGLAKDTPLNPTVVNQQIQNAVQNAYKPLKELGDVPVDQEHLDAMTRLGGSDRAAASIDPRLGNPQISALADALSPTGKALDPLTLQQKKPAWDSAAIVDTISALRGQASDAFSSGNSTLGKALKQGANSLESLVDRHLTATKGNGSQALTDFRVARTTIAKGHDVLGALNSATGDVDPRILARNDDGQMSGGLATLSNFAKAFPDAAAPSKGTPPGVTAFQANVEPSAGVAGAALNLLGRPTLRNYALGKTVQSQLANLQPKRATLNARALSAVFANPTAFSSMYEDQQ